MDSRIFSKQYGGGVVLLRQSEIVYLQVDDKYINIYTDTNKYYVRSSLNECMRKLEKNFIRISRNVVVNFDNAVCVQAERSILIIIIIKFLFIPIVFFIVFAFMYSEQI